MAKKTEVKNEIVNVNAFALYKINNEIDGFISSFVDTETGEMLSIAEAHFNNLSLKREEVIHQIGLAHVLNNAKSDAVDTEIKRLQAIKKSIDNRASLAKRLIEKELQENESFEFENLKISWKKNPSSIDYDTEMDTDMEQQFLEQLSITNPDLVGTKYTLKKKEVKELYKTTSTLSEGLTVIDDRKSLQIK